MFDPKSDGQHTSPKTAPERANTAPERAMVQVENPSREKPDVGTPLLRPPTSSSERVWDRSLSDPSRAGRQRSALSTGTEPVPGMRERENVQAHERQKRLQDRMAEQIEMDGKVQSAFAKQLIHRKFAAMPTPA
jgi:hypothetical protein